MISLFFITPREMFFGIARGTVPTKILTLYFHYLTYSTVKGRIARLSKTLSTL